MSDDGRMIRYGLLKLVAVAVLLLMLVACSTTGPVPDRFGGDREQDVTPDRWNLVRIARDLIGTPYRYGGSNPVSGFDCSGLVYYSYRQRHIGTAHNDHAAALGEPGFSRWVATGRSGLL